MNNTSSATDAYLDTHLDRYIEETCRLCAQPSVSSRNEGLQECSELVSALFSRHGFRVQVFETPGSPVVVARAEANHGTDRTLLFYNHYDVQPPEPLEQWTTPPFEPTIRDGALYARGACDDKGELLARIAAVNGVRAARQGSLPCNVVFVVEGQEEIGSPHMAEFAREHAALLRCHGAIWEEGGIELGGRPCTFLGCRGLLHVELRLRTMHQDAHSGAAHVLPNAAWRLVRLLDCLKDRDERIRIPGFYDGVIPPSDRDLELADALPCNDDFYRNVLGVREFVSGRGGQALNRAVFEPTCNIQGITTGHQGTGSKAVIPATATAKLDFRLVPGQDPDDILAKLHAYLLSQGYDDVGVTCLGAMWPAKVSDSNGLVRLAARAGEEVYGMPTLTDPLVGGSTPGYAFIQALGDIPVVTAGVAYWDNRTHAPDEHVRLVDFRNGARHIARIVDRFADLPADSLGSVTGSSK